MNSVQESKNELEAAIRYAENAISSAKQTIESMTFRQEMAQKNYQEQTGREAVLESELAGVRQLLDKMTLEHTDREKALEAEVAELKERVEFYDKQFQEMTQGVYAPTMPVIPKAVAIAIFREGMAYGASNVCDELDNSDDLSIEETGYTGPFEVSYSGYVELSDHLDFNFLRSAAVDNADEEWVVDCLKTLCATEKFECRIHGVDDQEEKKND